VNGEDVTFELTERNIYGTNHLGTLNAVVDMYAVNDEQNVSNILGQKYYSLSEHRANVLTVISDLKIPLSSNGTTVDAYQVGIVNTADYSGFGVQLDGRTFSSSTYRRGFQGQEMDDEIKGAGNSLNYTFRMHDPRVGRFNQIDPKSNAFGFNSPYNFVANSPIMFIDKNGEYPWPVYVRSFISTPTVGGGLFRGDGRGPSTLTSTSVTSRVTMKMNYDADKQEIIGSSAYCDFTMFYGTVFNGIVIPPKIKTAKPEAIISDVKSWENNQETHSRTGAFTFAYSAKDPITPQSTTPAIDVSGGFTIFEDKESNTLHVMTSIQGNLFPSTESFIEDQTGFRLFLGANKEEGGVENLVGSGKGNQLVSSKLEIKFNAKGKFTSVKDSLSDKTYTPKEWNKHVKSTFK
jgi:RHS repeat-associated protein